MVCLGRPYHFKFFKGCFPQILIGPFLNNLSHMEDSITRHYYAFQINSIILSITFLYPPKTSENFGFLMFSWSIERKNSEQIGWYRNRISLIKHFGFYTKIYLELGVLIQKLIWYIFIFVCSSIPANIYPFKVKNRNIKKGVNFEHISHLFVVFLLLTLNR